MPRAREARIPTKATAAALERFNFSMDGGLIPMILRKSEQTGKFENFFV
jgi:hypothetical protein